MKVYQGRYYYVWEMNLNGMIRYGVSRNLAIGGKLTLFITADVNEAIKFLKEIEEE